MHPVLSFLAFFRYPSQSILIIPHFSYIHHLVLTCLYGHEHPLPAPSPSLSLPPLLSRHLPPLSYLPTFFPTFLTYHLHRLTYIAVSQGLTSLISFVIDGEIMSFLRALL
jgi:hypothetical protein